MLEIEPQEWAVWALTSVIAALLVAMLFGIVWLSTRGRLTPGAGVAIFLTVFWTPFIVYLVSTSTVQELTGWALTTVIAALLVAMLFGIVWLSTRGRLTPGAGVAIFLTVFWTPFIVYFVST